METWAWRHRDMETWTLRLGEMDMDIDMEKWRHHTENEK
jgi:hypothetical protein